MGASARCWRAAWRKPLRSRRIWASVPPRFPKAAAASAPETSGRTMHEAESDAVARDLIQTEDRWGAHNYRPLDVVVERAQGVWVHAVDGRRYMDCLSAYSALNQGHCHPRILQAMIEQMSRVTLTSRAFRNDQLPRFCEELAQICGMQMVLPMNTGAEAVESAMKAVRRWGYTRSEERS